MNISSSDLVESAVTMVYKTKLNSFLLRVIVLKLIAVFGFVLTNSSTHEDTLRLIIIFFRHGARAPSRTYGVTDNYTNNWIDGWGALTKTGKLQMYDLGKQYRAQYSKFLPQEYYEKDVTVQSSEKSRCLMSAYTFLAGLYPPTQRQTWHPDIPWMPIPVRSLPKHLDNIVAATKHCTLQRKIYFELLNETRFRPDLLQLYKYLNEKTHETISNVADINYLFSSLLAQEQEGLAIPDWSIEVLPKLKEYYVLGLELLSYNDTMLRLRAGPLLSQIKHNLEGAMHGRGHHKLYVYSGHDVNVVSLWRSLGFTSSLYPGYGASLTLELHKFKDHKFYVKAFLRNDTQVKVPLDINLPYCDNPCPYSNFATHITKLIPTKWHEECETTL